MWITKKLIYELVAPAMKKSFKILLRKRSGGREKQVSKFTLSQLMSDLETTPREANLNEQPLSETQTTTL
jgi:hypothetical protein